ncbi:hypothetical protein [Glycomyces dulcitolivorans]|uniref:hypothetical protein n=1 Tax=Glycomyces dulcitolivorans TaxID=2200759 RepID=UPI000DD3B54B|nr:hypothetical protein [Glycomyces dulcitolivorans]
MEEVVYPHPSKLLNERYGRGYAAGFLLGYREVLLEYIDEFGMTLSEHERREIDASNDITILRAWVKRVVRFAVENHAHSD